MEYLAHIRKKDGAKQYLFEHLEGVAKKSGEFASKIGLGNQGELIGLLHDFGKYSDQFQNYLKSAGELINPDEDDFIDAQGMKGKIDHSTAGSQYLDKWFQSKGTEARLAAQFLSLCLASHHSGLIDCLAPDGTNIFSRRMAKSDNKTHYEEVIQRIDRQIRDRLDKLVSDTGDCEALIKKLKVVHNPEEKSKITTIFKQGLLVRFMFSCLIDADRLDTADFEEPHLKSFRNNGRYRSWEELINRLENRLAAFKQRNKVDALRVEISNHCREYAEKPKGIYTLTVPTGGGKTLASLRFAMHHAKKYIMDRVIYVIPYTSIIDQNADEVRKFLEDRDSSGEYLHRVVLEHHSNLTSEEETWQQKILAQDWDAPIVFTTSVQVMEALFGSGTRSVRRMHQLARSTIIFDEVQTIPVRCVHMFNNAINFLVQMCGSTVVLCTATQPLLSQVDKSLGALKIQPEQEIMPDVGRLFSDLKRVEVVDAQKVGGWSSDEVAALAEKQIQGSGSALVIVNTRKAARELYELCRLKDQNGIYHLSTNMCPAHRMSVLENVRLCLDIENSKPVLCISTQLIEAGVDVDFGSVIRYVAGLDSIAQAAGRCNRNGIRQNGTVFIVNPASENLEPLKDIKVGKEKAERVLREFNQNRANFDHDIIGPKAIDCYFKYYFYDRKSEMKYPVSRNVLIGRDDNLLALLSTNETTVAEYMRINNSAPEINFRQSFMTAAKAFQAIDKITRGVIVQHGKEGKKIVSELCSAFEPEKQFGLLRRAQRYSVNLFPHEWKKLDEEENAIHEVQKGAGIYYLEERYYSPIFGLSMTPVNQLSYLEE